MNNKRIWSNLWMLLPTGFDKLWRWITSLGWITSLDVRWMFQRWDSGLDLLETSRPFIFPKQKSSFTLIQHWTTRGPLLSSKISVKKPFPSKVGWISVGFPWLLIHKGLHRFGAWTPTNLAGQFEVSLRFNFIPTSSQSSSKFQLVCLFPIFSWELFQVRLLFPVGWLQVMGLFQQQLHHHQQHN